MASFCRNACGKYLQNHLWHLFAASWSVSFVSAHEPSVEKDGGGMRHGLPCGHGHTCLLGMGMACRVGMGLGMPAGCDNCDGSVSLPMLSCLSPNTTNGVG